MRIDLRDEKNRLFENNFLFNLYIHYQNTDKTQASDKHVDQAKYAITITNLKIIDYIIF